MKKLTLTVWTMWKIFLDEDDESDFVLEEGEVREVLAAAWKQKRQQISKKRDCVQGVENLRNQRRLP